MPEKYSARARRERLPAVPARILLVTAAAGLIGTAFILSSCARKNQASQSPPASAASASEAPGAGAPAVEALPGQAPGKRPAAAKPALTLAAALRAFGLGVPSVPRIPEDFALGPLQSYRPAEGDEAAVFAVAKAFMDGVTAGKLDESLLLPEAREALSVLLAPAAPQASRGAAAPSYRLGEITIKGEDASLMLRMPRSDASSVREEGLLSLRKAGDAWYVQALALKPPDSAALVFAPDARDKSK
jgi:hypothetical protein